MLVNVQIFPFLKGKSQTIHSNSNPIDVFIIILGWFPWGWYKWHPIGKDSRSVHVYNGINNIYYYDMYLQNGDFNTGKIGS